MEFGYIDSVEVILPGTQFLVQYNIKFGKGLSTSNVINLPEWADIMKDAGRESVKDMVGIPIIVESKYPLKWRINKNSIRGR